ncbi:DUF4190 domain-containing protein [Streptomyces sp. NPDC000594]|uniref:DUF4190 domain-containing protein n=1 Tax=Streptomyces sp. NPDC000594 TaxID=3154261 RepID=UPI00331B20F0
MEPSQYGGQWPDRPGPQGASHPHPAYRPYHGYPGGPGGPGYSPAPPGPPPTNGFSVASLVAGVVCCLPPLGLVLGIIALVQIRRRREQGTGMAVAGTVLSALSTLLTLVLLVTGGAAELWRGAQEGMEAAGRSQSTLDLAEGDCLNLPGDGPLGEGDAYAVDVVECEKGHEAEITGSFRLVGYDRFPGDDRIEPLAERRCEEINWMYARDEWLVQGRMELYYYAPTKGSWATGDSTVTCAFATVDGSRTRGTIRRDPSNLTALPLAYLTAETKAFLTGADIPPEEFTEAPGAHRTWARESSKVFDEQIRALRAYAWPKALAGPVERRAKELERAGRAWDRAARARDEEIFWTEIATVEEVLADGPTEVEIRRLLKLPSVPPERPDDGDTGDEGEDV